MWYFLFTGLLCLNGLAQAAPAPQKERRDPCTYNPPAKVWPTLKAVPDITFGSHMEYRLVQINWIVSEVYEGDWIGVFNDDPRQEKLPKLRRKQKYDDDNIIDLPTDTSYTTDSTSVDDVTTVINSDSQVISDELTSSESDTSGKSIPKNKKDSEEFNDFSKEASLWPDDIVHINSTSATTEGEGFKILFRARPYSSKGLMTTTVTYKRPNMTVLVEGHCAGAWVAYIRDGHVLDTRCISSQPSWMWNNKDTLGNWSLSSLVIPGTHNSGSFFLNDTYDSVATWVVCQDEDVVSQLLYGIRYLDLRVAYYPETPELLWINHDIVRWKPLRDVLNDIVAFVTYSPDPVIVDIHRTPVGFEEHPEASLLLVSLLNSTLGTFALPARFTSQVTLNQIWADGRRLIISYGDVDIRRQNPWLWQPIKQEWANAQTLNDLQKYIDRKMNDMSRIAVEWRPIWAAMGHLTPTLWDILLGTGKGVRGMADRTGSAINDWLLERWTTKANIITSDFFHTNDIIHSSIEINLMGAKCPIKLEKKYHRMSPRFTKSKIVTTTIPQVVQRGRYRLGKR